MFYNDMNSKLLLLFAFVTTIEAGFISTHQTYQAASTALSKAVVPEVAANLNDYDPDPDPRYIYSYDVEDKRTGDSKSQNEQRDGDAVHGEYYLVDADGYKRTVKYTANDPSGFNAVVKRVPAVYANGNPPMIQEFVHSLAPIGSAEHDTHSDAPVSEYASRYTSYDAPIYLKSALQY